MLFKQTVCPDPQFKYSAESSQEQQFLRQLRQHRAKIQQLTHSYNLKQEHRLSSLKQLQLTKKQFLQCEKALQDKQHNLQILQSKNKKLIRQNDNLKVDIKSYTNRLASIDSAQTMQLNRHKQLLQQAQTSLTSLKVDNQSKTTSLNTLQKRYEQRGRKLVELQTRLNQIMPQLSNINIRNDNLTKELFQKNQRNDELTRQLIKMKQQKYELQKSYQILHQQNISISNNKILLKGKFQEVNKESINYKKLVDKLQQEIRTCLQQLKLYQNQIQSLRMQRSSLQKQVIQRRGLGRGIEVYQQTRREMEQLRCRQVSSIQRLLNNIS